MGRTLAGLLRDCQLSSDQLPLLTKQMGKQKCSYFQIPDDDIWKIDVIQECLGILSGETEVPNFSPLDFRALLDCLCTT